jgi:AcrR family transcriptional regulator
MLYKHGSEYAGDGNSVAIRISFRFGMKKHRPRITARKAPQQSRSRVTVEAILDGAIRVLEQEGSLAMTTTRVAQAAGVSVGTLYQYFPNRQSILDALQEREFQRTTAMLQAVMVDSPAGSTDELARAVIRGLFKLYGAAPELHRVLAIEGLIGEAPKQVIAFDLRMVNLVRSVLAGARLICRRKNVDAAAFVAYQSVRASMLAHLLEAPSGLDEAALTEELADLLHRYLVAS